MSYYIIYFFLEIFNILIIRITQSLILSSPSAQATHGIIAPIWNHSFTTSIHIPIMPTLFKNVCRTIKTITQWCEPLFTGIPYSLSCDPSACLHTKKTKKNNTLSLHSWNVIFCLSDLSIQFDPHGPSLSSCDILTWVVIKVTSHGSFEYNDSWYAPLRADHVVSSNKWLGVLEHLLTWPNKKQKQITSTQCHDFGAMSLF